jgi:tetratricopeptide (TPR) repeat protein
MKRNYVRCLLAGMIVPLGVALMMSSCHSAPAVEEPAIPVVSVPDPNGPVDQASLDALASAAERLEKARFQAQDVEGNVIFPEEWEAAEARHEAFALQSSPVTRREAQETAAGLEELAGAYDGIFQNSVPLYAEALREELARARFEAVDTGIEDLSPDRLTAADDLAVSAQTQYDQGDYYPAAETAYSALDAYSALAAGALGFRQQQEIEAREFVQDDPENYALALSAFDEALAAYDSGDIPEALDLALQAMFRYNQTLRFGWVSYTEEREVTATIPREASMDLKANIAAKEQFEAAEAVYNQAYAALRAGEYEKAVEFFEQSGDLFTDVYATVVEKRQRAEEAIRDAEELVTRSGETAQGAEKILEGGAE